MGVLWVLFYFVYAVLPYTRNATYLIYETKVDHALHQPLFPSGASCRVLMLGNSQVLSGFIPDRFDALAGKNVASYNMGLPAETLFVDNLERILENGGHPTHVFITSTWQPDNPNRRNLFNPIESDAEFLQQLFPFRHLPRDLVLFFLRAHDHDGLAANYRYVHRSVHNVLRDRGYYFVDGQSHYPRNRIPDDFRAATDDPQRIAPRKVLVEGSEFERLIGMAEKYDFQLFFLPLYCRPGQVAPAPPVNQQTAQSIRPYPRLHLLGPDYFIYPNRCFADELHLNPEGAAVYTEDVFKLTRETLPTAPK